MLLLLFLHFKFLFFLLVSLFRRCLLLDNKLVSVVIHKLFVRDDVFERNNLMILTRVATLLQLGLKHMVELKGKSVASLLYWCSFL